MLNTIQNSVCHVIEPCGNTLRAANHVIRGILHISRLRSQRSGDSAEFIGGAFNLGGYAGNNLPRVVLMIGMTEERSSSTCC